MNTETSIHWHGLILENQYDGVPYLTSAPVEAGTTQLYRFPLVQSGTYWYHSHTKLQEQVGMYGALIIHKRNEPKMHEEVLVLSDWTNEKPYEVHRKLHHATDWYAIRKGSTQNYGQAIKEGYFKTKVENEYKRMLAMDVSDVAYDRFFINGTDSSSIKKYSKGDKVKLRIINGGSSTYFWVRFSGSKLSVVASDGSDVVPVEVDRLIIGVSETYDVIVTIPDNNSYEFMATAEDRTKSASLFIGNGDPRPLKSLPKLKYFEGMKMMNDMMKLNGDMNDMGMNMSLQTMDMNAVMYPEITGSAKESDSNEHSNHNHSASSQELVTLNYSMLRSPVKTTLPDAPVKELRFELTGNMNRYVWTINNKTVSETDKILIKKGENVRIVMFNNSMMRHPMHLHGHFFRVLNGHGDYAPLKNVIDIMPMETDTIEFAATESGDWFFHCHILYHMMSGMGRIFSYENSPPNPQLPNPEKALRKLYRDDRELHPSITVSLESNGSEGEAMLANTRYFLETHWHIGLDKEHGYESETHLGRYFGRNQFLNAYVGFDYRYRKMMHDEENLFGQSSSNDDRSVFCAGVQYVLPMLITADFRIDHTGDLRLTLSREDIPLTSRLRLNGMYNTDREYSAGLKYILTKFLAVSTHYDSDMGYGAGITLNY